MLRNNEVTRKNFGNSRIKTIDKWGEVIYKECV